MPEEEASARKYAFLLTFYQKEDKNLIVALSWGVMAQGRLVKGVSNPGRCRQIDE